MQQIIRIPEPCFENWNEMSPREQGRHCNACSKTVVDFTGWHPQEILFYLKANAGTCGRFRNDQLNIPIPSPDEFVQHISSSSLPVMKKIAAVFLFVFCVMAVSCNNEPPAQPSVMGGMMIDTTIQCIDDTTCVSRPVDRHPLRNSVVVPDSAVIGEPVPITDGYNTGGIPEFEPYPYPRDTTAVKADTAKPITLPDTIKVR